MSRRVLADVQGRLSFAVFQEDVRELLVSLVMSQALLLDDLIDAVDISLVVLWDESPLQSVMCCIPLRLWMEPVTVLSHYG